MKKTVAVFFGGRSTEHDISIITAISAVIKPLELSRKYSVVPVYVAKDGAWYSDQKLKNIKLYQGGGIEEFCKKTKPVLVSFNGGLTLHQKSRGKKINIDIAFPAMHGTYGEDGSLMGTLRMANIPFVGSDMQASVIAMDKVLAKQVVQANGIPTPKFVSFSKNEFETSPEGIAKEVVDNLSFPVFVKPAHLGSSIGITRVSDAKDLINAIEVAMHYDDRALVEQEVPNLIEVTVPIMGNDVLQPALVERPLSDKEKFFDFDTKYMHGGKKKGGSDTVGSQGYSEVPAKIDQDLYDKAVKTAEDSYIATGASGLSRIDLLIDEKDKTVYFNEINPLPGSLYAHNWRQAGISGVQLVDKLVELAEERFAAKQKIENTFQTSFLKQF